VLEAVCMDRGEDLFCWFERACGIATRNVRRRSTWRRSGVFLFPRETKAAGTFAFLILCEIRLWKMRCDRAGEFGRFSVPTRPAHSAATAAQSAVHHVRQ